MIRLTALHLLLLCVLLTSLASVEARAQTTNSAQSVERGIALAHRGKCKEALPILKSARPTDKQLKFDAQMLLARCAMSLDQTQTAVETLLAMNREFPQDPEVLYTTVHFYSDLASRASQQLATTAPNSAQAEKLEAESFESQGDWDRAIAQYKRILEQNPKEPEIHFRLGRILTTKNPPDPDGAVKEFEEELKVNPTNAPAEFMLGETARQAGQWDEAVEHFSHAVKLDEGFSEAYLGLGMSLNSAGKFSEAVPPLEAYVKLQPGDPAGHYQLATAFARTGRKADADREMALQREAAAKSPRAQEH
jgi:tetratricopeptide (TPR) repeat protein